jgi:hypothetical protein
MMRAKRVIERQGRHKGNLSLQQRALRARVTAMRKEEGNGESINVKNEKKKTRKRRRGKLIRKRYWN